MRRGRLGWIWRQHSYSGGQLAEPVQSVYGDSFSLPAAGAVTLRVYDMAGREVATLADRFFSEGSQSVVFDGSSLASGTNCNTIRSEGHIETRSMQLIK